MRNICAQRLRFIEAQHGVYPDIALNIILRHKHGGVNGYRVVVLYIRCAYVIIYMCVFRNEMPLGNADKNFLVAPGGDYDIIFRKISPFSLVYYIIMRKFNMINERISHGEFVYFKQKKPAAAVLRGSAGFMNSLKIAPVLGQDSGSMTLLRRFKQAPPLP